MTTRKKKAGTTSRRPRPVSGMQIIQIAATGLLSHRTVLRVYDGAGSAYSRERVARTARELGLPEP